MQVHVSNDAATSVATGALVVPVFASGTPLGDLFTPELMRGGYRKKYFRAISRLTALARDAELRHVIREQLLGPGAIQVRQVFERAVARGEIPQGRNLDLLISVFPALVIHHLLIFGELPDASFAAQVMNDLILPLAVTPQ